MRIKTFALAFPLFFTSLCAVGQEVTDVKTQINQIKKNTSDYIYAEITATTEPDAKMLAEDLLYEEINKWAATQQNLQASQKFLVNNKTSCITTLSTTRGNSRVKSQLRRYMKLGGGTVRPDTIVIGGIELNDVTKEVTLDGDKVQLTRTEYDILKLLMQHPGQVFSPNEIYEKVWNDNPFRNENTVAVHIRHLREKVEYNPAEPRHLKVVWGRGYKMEV